MQSRFSPSIFAAILLLSAGGSFRLAAQSFEPGPPLPEPRSLYLLDVPFLHFASPDFEPPVPGRVRLGVESAYANTFSHTWQAKAYHAGAGLSNQPFTREEAEYMHREFPGETMIFLDAEVTRVALRGTVGLSGEFSLSVEIPYVSWGALHGDGAVEGFHSLVGLADSQRPDFPRGRFQIVLQRPDGALEFDDRQPEAGLGDATASLQWRRRAGARTALAVNVALKAPTGSARDYRGSGSFDAGVQAGALRRLGRTGRFGIRAEAALVIPGRFRSESAVSIPADPFVRLLVGGDVRLGRDTFASLWVVGEESPQHRDERGDVARTSVEFGLGIDRRFGALGAVSLSLVENVPRYGDAADIAVGLRIRHDL